MHGNGFIVYFEHRKKSCSNDEDTSTVSRNPNGSLSKPRKPSSKMPRFVKTLHGNYLQNMLNFYHYIMKWNLGTMPSFKFFWLILHVQQFWEKVHFWGSFEHRKKSFSNDEHTSTISRNPSGSLSEPHNPSSEMHRLVKTLHGNYFESILKFYHCIRKSNHGTMPSFNFFWLILHF